MGTTQCHTIVVGSGIAGMAAANKLANKNFPVLVLQAESYIGGRTKTIDVPLNNGAIFSFDQGASWIHGSSKNHPITKLSKQIQGLKTGITDDDSIINFDENGNNVNKQVQRQFQEYEKLIEKAQDSEGVSVFSAIQKLKSDKLKNKFFMYNISYDMEFQTSGTIEDLSAQHGLDDQEFDGRQEIICSGYQKFPQHLAKNDKIKVLLNHKVVKIQNLGEKTKVVCQNGQAFQAPHIIVAVPIGVLKHHSIKFQPQLPNWKQQAIKNIHFGNVCKILIIFKNNKIPNRKQTYIGVVEDDVSKRGSATYFLNLQSLIGMPAMMTFGLGANSEDLQNMPQHQLKQLIASRIRVFGDKSFGVNDFQIKRTAWRHSNNFKGTYSYSGVQTKPKDWMNMAKPLFNVRWHFCGEHTIQMYRGSVHGAYLSGLASADEILQNIVQSKWRYKGALKSNNKQSSSSSSEQKKKKNERKQSSSSSSEKGKKRKN